MTFIRPLLLCSAFLALSFDLLLHDLVTGKAPLGIGLSVMLSCSIAALIFLSVRTKLPGRRRSLYFLIPAFLLSLGCAWRDSHTLSALDLYLVVFFLFVSSVSMQGCKMLIAGVSRYIQVFKCMTESLVIQPVEVIFKELKWQELLPSSIASHTGALARGLFISLPLLFTFGLLLTSADAAYSSLLQKSFKIDLQAFTMHCFLIIMALWCSLGTLSRMFAGKMHGKDLSVEDVPSLKLGAIEVCTITGVINLLFLSFVLVQIQYFFGGANVVALTSGLTYAEYARRGFFELVTVVALVLPTLLFLDWTFVQKSRLGIFLFRGLTFAQISMLFVMMASAVKRMMLYQMEYGQTELRLYTTAFMGLMAIVFVIFTLTVLRGYRKHFAFASIVAGLLVTATMHFINPDAMIVQANLDRAKAGKDFDIEYNLSLSKDAIPVLVSRLGELSKEKQILVRDRLESDYVFSSRFSKFKDWRHWNWARAKADQFVGKELRQKTIGMNYPPDKPKINQVTGKI
ncbi:MAG: DUF4173 domain-containing protein [Candidatus Melainabacteria bacterium]|nr:DUF4173 domain-containing protein [Candidatus Melainabacteria bacterium]